MKFALTAPCLFGIESVLKKEIADLGYEILSVDDGRVVYAGDAAAIPRSNLHLRTAERVLLNVGSFEAKTFEELFEKTKALPWEDFIPKDGKFWVKKASSIKSKLFSPSDIQSVMKKAVVERLKKKHKTDWFPETGASYPIRVFIKKDQVSVGLDTSGEALHKRGYRTNTGIAPLRETLAAGIVLLSGWNKDRLFVDPFCGSGTLPIEAAMIAARMAPGLNREFLSETWTNLLERKAWMQAVDEANDLLDLEVQAQIQGFDKDYRMIRFARENAENADVANLIHFQERPVKELASSRKYGIIVTNPPYGERLEELQEVYGLYKELGKVCAQLDSWSVNVITSVEDFERHFGRQADKKRKLYNGMIKTTLYRYEGPKPPKGGQGYGHA
ncbi:class I SAM-dependent RNA methyltransferase [Anaerotalea alkaliphila]